MTNSPLSGDASNDPTDDQTGRFVRQPNGRVRPLSPHLQVWRWHVTMLGSILHRMTGGALYFGILAVAFWVISAAFGPDAYAAYSGLAGSPIGLLVWFGLTLSGVYHLFSGIRHLVWDTGAGLTPKGSSAFTTLTIVAALVVAVGFWVALFATGKVSL